MKIRNLLIIIILFPAASFSQSLNGIWTGVLSNDSTTIRKDQSFELALTEYRGKVYGYAYSTFIVRDTLYYIVKRVKGKIDGNTCEVEDDEVITHNFPKKPEKKVFVTYTLRRNTEDSVWYLDGTWKTNTTRRYYAISGGVKTREERDLAKSKLYEHLGDLNLQQTVALNNPEHPNHNTDNEKSGRPNIDIVKAKVIDEEKADIVMAGIGVPENHPESYITGINANIQRSDSISREIAKTEQAFNVKKDDPKVADSIVQKDVAMNVPVSPDRIAGNAQQNNQSNNQVKQDSQAVNPTLDPKTGAVQKRDLAVNDPAGKQLVSVPPDTRRAAQDKQNDQSENKQQASSVAVNDPNRKQLVSVPPDTRKAEQDKQNDQSENKQQASSVAVNDPNRKQLVSVPPDNRRAAQDNQNDLKENKQQVNPVAANDPARKQLVSVPPGTRIAEQNKQEDPANAAAKKQLVSVPPGTRIPNQDKQGNPADTLSGQNNTAYLFNETRRVNRTLKPASTMLTGRESAPSETIFFKADSLVLSLYDNGEVDGDTVSVILNDQVIIEKQGLKSSAYKKTIYLAPEESDSVLLVLFAENLGKYPPNTGLLTVKDGDDLYYVRFKADFDRNAAILLKRKKGE